MAPPSSPPAAGEGVNMVKHAQAVRVLLWTWVLFRIRVFIFYLEVRDHS